jgi:hypothetical protein
VCSHGKKKEEGREEGGEEAEDHQEAQGGEAPTLNKSPSSSSGFCF